MKGQRRRIFTPGRSAHRAVSGKTRTCHARRPRLEPVKLEAQPIEGKIMEDSPKTQPTNPQKGTPWGLILIMIGFFLATGLVIGIGVISLDLGLGG